MSDVRLDALKEAKPTRKTFRDKYPWKREEESQDESMMEQHNESEIVVEERFIKLETEKFLKTSQKEKFHEVKKREEKEKPLVCGSTANPRCSNALVMRGKREMKCDEEEPRTRGGKTQQERKPVTKRLFQKQSTYQTAFRRYKYVGVRMYSNKNNKLNCNGDHKQSKDKNETGKPECPQEDKAQSSGKESAIRKKFPWNSICKGKNKGNEDKGKEDKGKEDKGKEDKSKEDKGKEDKSKEDKCKEDKSKEDKGKEDKSKEDKSNNKLDDCSKECFLTRLSALKQKEREMAEKAAKEEAEEKECGDRKEEEKECADRKEEEKECAESKEEDEHFEDDKVKGKSETSGKNEKCFEEYEKRVQRRIAIMKCKEAKNQVCQGDAPEKETGE